MNQELQQLIEILHEPAVVQGMRESLPRDMPRGEREHYILSAKLHTVFRHTNDLDVVIALPLPLVRCLEHLAEEGGIQLGTVLLQTLIRGFTPDLTSAECVQGVLLSELNREFNEEAIH